MPNSVVKNLAERANLPVPVVELVWRRAKRFVANEGQKGNYLRVLEVSKRMLRMTDTVKSARIGQLVRWKTKSGEMQGIIEGTLPDCCMVRVIYPETTPNMEAVLRESATRKQGIVVVPLLDIIL